MNSRRIRSGELGSAIEQELTIYSQQVNEGLEKATIEAAEKLVKKTKATAPVGKRNGTFRKNIAYLYGHLNRRGNRAKGQLRGRTIKATWYVKGSDYRLTHLLVHGHATKNGGRTKPNPFLQNAVDEVIPEFEKAVEEVIKNGK